MYSDSLYRCRGLKGDIGFCMRCGGYKEKKKEAHYWPLKVYII